MARIFTDEEKLGIYNDYANCMSIKKIAKKYHTGYKKVKTTLLEQGIDINDYSKPIGIKKHVANYWNSYENLEALAKICTSKKDFDNHSHSAWIAAKRNGWFDELAEKYFKPKVKELKPSNRYMVYAFEIPSKHSVYIGRTMNLKKRIATHKWSPYGDAFNQYCEKNNIDFPEPIILQKDMEVEEAKEVRKKFISQYKADGWKIINAISKKEKTEPKDRIKWTSDIYGGEKMHGKLTEFIAKAKACHPDENLDYSKAIYINNRTPLCIIDHDLKDDGTEYGEYWQTPYNHLKGQSHPLKKGRKISKSTLSKQDEIIKRFNGIHKGEGLDYSKVEYKGMHQKVCIIDPEYGEYWQEPVVHLKGCGHPDRNKGGKVSLTTEEFINKAHLTHGNKYDYKLSVCEGYRSPVTIICPKHGEFVQTAENHLAGKGCPRCGYVISKAEDEIASLIPYPIIRRDHSVLDGKEIDIYVPSLKVGIEYNGNKWHTEWFGGKDRNYHVSKTNEALAKEIRLIQIFEDEWAEHRDIVISKIQHILGLSNDLPRIGARKCIVEKIDNDMAKDFLEKYHIQGYAASTMHYGAFYEKKLIGVMSFLKEHISDEWNLTRFATDYNYICQGIGGKLFKRFIEDSNPVKIKSFADRRWTTNPESNIYAKLGFELEEILKPDYKYYNFAVDRVRRFHKFGFRKQILSRRYGFPMGMSETDMVKKLGYDRIWDCGLYKYVWRKK